MQVNPQIFRAYDLRGVVGDDLSPKFFNHLGKAYSTFVKRENIDRIVVVGRDARETSEEYSKSLVDGILWSGLDVVDIGLNFVGNFYWAQYFLKHNAGVFITASHNPKNYNGAKFSVGYSETMVTHQMNVLRTIVEQEDYEKGEKGEYSVHDIKKAYIKDMRSRVKMDRPLKVLVDTSFSTGGAIVPDVFKAFDLEVVEKNTKVDSSFPLGAPDPTETKLEHRLGKETKAVGADIGFSYDSDGDRVGIVDEKGKVIWNDMIVALLTIEILHHHKGDKIMFNSLCSRAVPETIVKYGGEPFMWRTGHSFLKKKNQEVGAAFIGELSGHFFFSKDFYNHDDGIYSSLRLISYLSRSKKTLSELIADLPQYKSSPEIKVGYPDDKKEAFVKKLAKQIRGDMPNAIVLDDERIGDGVRFETDTSMFVIRYSQNGPYITIKIEAVTNEEYESLRIYISELLKNNDEVNWEFGVSQNLLKPHSKTTFTTE